MNTEIQKTETDLSVAEYFAPFEQQAQEWLDKAKGIIVQDESQTELMKGARAARLELRKIRVNVENKRKELKEDYLRKGQQIDSIAKRLKALIEPSEEHLQLQEDFVKIKAETARKQLLDNRVKQLEPFIGDEARMMTVLADMSDFAFENMVKGYAMAKEENERQAAILKEQQEKEYAAAVEERKRILAENEYRKLENEKLQARLKKEREAKEKLEREAREKLEKEEAERKAEQAAERKAKRAPDKEKLLNWADKIQEFWDKEDSKFKDEEAQKIFEESGVLLTKIRVYIRKNAEKL